MWIARDKDGSLWLYTDKPIKGKDMWVCEDFFNSVCHEIGKIFPLPEITWENSPLELIIKPEESEDEKIRKNLITFFKEEYGTNSNARFAGIKVKDVIAWLEKQDDNKKDIDYAKPELEKQLDITKSSEEEQNRFAKGVLSNCALSFINYLDAHKYKDKLCVSNEECEDIENAFHNAMWDKLHRYYCKYIEKQDEQNPYNGVSFKYNSHTFGMCARDGGVEILIDGNLKAFVSLDKSFIYPINLQPILVPQALEAAKEENVDNQNCEKPTDNIEPKYKEGDWIVSEVTGSAYQIKYCVENLNTHKYGYDLTNGGYLGSYDANHYHLWTVQDAKDGDVLVASDNSIFIFSHCRDNACVHHIALEVEDGTMDINYKLERGWETIRGVCPATKEQHDILFKAMTDAGYEFDFDKKELKKIK